MSLPESATHPSLSFYATPGIMTILEPAPGPLPSGLPELCALVQGLLIHPLLAGLYGADLTAVQKKEVNLRPAAAILELVCTLDPRPLSVARAPAERVVGNCRDHALLLCALLRSQGRPARARCGFATYLGKDLHHDHWISEVWDATRACWARVDPQLDALQREHFNIPFDPCDLPGGAFLSASEAWSLCRARKASSGVFGHSRHKRGWPYLRGQLFLDLAALDKCELLPWDFWWDLGSKDESRVTAGDRAWLDSAAATMNGLAADPPGAFDGVRVLCDDPIYAGPLHSHLLLLGLEAEPGASAIAVAVASAETPRHGVPAGDGASGAQPESTGKQPPAPPAASESPLAPSDLDRLATLAAQVSAGENTGSPTRHAPVGYAKNGDAAAIDLSHFIVIRGAAHHNLKHINLVLPRNKLVVLTGVSGSGKSTLAFDTLYAEGQRRYVESLSAYVRRYLDQMDKPKVDFIGGLSPAISIEQKSVSKNPRSTVGTITEVMDYLRVLYSRAGIQHCPRCKRAITPASPQMIADRLIKLPPGTRFQLIAPLARERKGDHAALLERARKDGFTRVLIDGEPYDLDLPKSLPKLLKSQPHTISVIVDRLIAPGEDEDVATRSSFAARLVDSVETTLRAGSGQLILALGGDTHAASEGLAHSKGLAHSEGLRLSENNVCPHCDITLPELSPGMFSFNAPAGMCPECNGLGTRLQVDPGRIVEHPELSLMDGASRWYGVVRKKQGYNLRGLKTIADQMGVDLEAPWKDLPEVFRNVLLWGSGERKFHFTYRNQDGSWMAQGESPERGIVYHINRLFRQTQSEYTRRFYMSFMSQQPCEACGGSRLCAEARYVTVGGITFPEVLSMTIQDAYTWVDRLAGGGLAPENGRLDAEQLEVVGEVLKELRSRLRFMLDVGLHYLNLSRPAPTLSGGEGQRIRLASQLGCGLVGVLYILDEPSIGLHARDQRNLLDTLLHLRDMGNTVLVVEHDAETMRTADWLVDLGPGAGVKGGEVVAEGTPAQVAAEAAAGQNTRSLTGQYLSGLLQVSAPNGLHRDGVHRDGVRRRVARGWLTIRGARLFNLKHVTARFPIGAVTCVTGVSGSGKSSLVTETLYPALARALMGAQSTPGPYERLEGLELLDKVINITQEPIGRTPRSNPATYVGLFDDIRQVFAAVPEARMRGYTPARFSFNVKGGRCESCMGHGMKRVEMHFLPDVWVTCQECKGARYNRHTLEITYKGKNISEALDMDVQEALEYFAAHPKIERMLRTLHDVGLDYVKLGQSATTLSGGEAQRVKLAKELGRVATGDTIYILDEPTTGLHFADIQRLLDVLHRLADSGNTVIIIEHNMDVIKTADWIVDLGPEGGDAGGYILTEGTPEQVARAEGSFTGQFLQAVL